MMFDLKFNEELSSSSEEAGEPIDGLQMMQDIINNEEELARKYFNLEEILEFCRHNKVEVLQQDNYQFHCYINFKLGDGSYYSTIRNPLTAMVMGIRTFKRLKE